MSRRGRWIVLASVSAIVGAGWQLLPASSALRNPATWQRLALPGALSHAHAELENDCAACHRSVVGVEDSKCVACHVSNERLLTWPETIFHASIQQCGTCHLEHRGREAEISAMDHVLLASTALGELERGAPQELSGTASHLAAMLAERKGRPEAEDLLRCDGCHARKDVHEGLFGAQCGSCHETARWVIPAYEHPSGRSEDCAQCHRAPPDHFGGHFERMGRSDVRQCAMCHQPPSWLDIGHPRGSITNTLRSTADRVEAKSNSSSRRPRRGFAESKSPKKPHAVYRPRSVCNPDCLSRGEADGAL